MFISAPRVLRENGEVRISATIRMAEKKRSLPTELWFSFPEKFESEITVGVAPFVTSLLLLAMQAGEPIEAEGKLSQRLHTGLDRYQSIFQSWYPDRFQRIQIKTEGFEIIETGKPREALKPKIACAFSGGVDSFYSFFSLLTKDQKNTIGLTHAVFMAGFDMPLHLTESISELTRAYAKLMEDRGIQFVTGRTNLRDFVNTVDWTNAHGQALCATALFFKDAWTQFYIPSSYTLSGHPRWGTHPMLDPLLSTESLEFVHHGTNANRVEKLKFLMRFPETFSNLRVCWIQDIGLKNCGECEKCVRTMIGLEILGVAAHYSTFNTKLYMEKIRSLKLRTYQSRIFAKELIAEAGKQKRLDIILNLSLAFLKRSFFRTKLWMFERRKQNP